MSKAISKPGKMLLSPNDHTLVMIDFQSQMALLQRHWARSETATCGGA
jgi:hypothetical protein